MKVGYYHQHVTIGRGGAALMLSADVFMLGLRQPIYRCMQFLSQSAKIDGLSSNTLPPRPCYDTGGVGTPLCLPKFFFRASTSAADYDQARSKIYTRHFERSIASFLNAEIRQLRENAFHRKINKDQPVCQMERATPKLDIEGAVFYYVLWK